MEEQRWVYRLSDNVFLRGGFFELPYNPETEGVAVFTDLPPPDLILDRYDNTQPTLRRLATAEELAAAETAAHQQIADYVFIEGVPVFSLDPRTLKLTIGAIVKQCHLKMALICEAASIPQSTIGTLAEFSDDIRTDFLQGLGE